jgi:GT2 family glycosyltransferase
MENRTVRDRKIFDCFLYNGEESVLEIRLHELCDTVDVFVIVESDMTFSGLPNKPAFDVLDKRVSPFASKIRHVVVRDMPATTDPWERERWQRNAVLRGIPDALADDLIVLSDVDEISRATILAQIKQDDEFSVFGFELNLYYFFANYRNIAGPEASITWTVAARRRILEETTPDTLRYQVRDKKIPARIFQDAGWHFSYLMDPRTIEAKIKSFSHQEFNNTKFLSSLNVESIVRDRRGLFGRAGFEWALVDPSESPVWLFDNRRLRPKLFAPRTNYEKIERSIRRLLPRASSHNSERRKPHKPVVICPYLYDHEQEEIRAKFRLDSEAGRKIDAFLFHDKDRMGPERAFEHCWKRFPDRDIIILHSDMAPMPGDENNSWWDRLLHYRDVLPKAGMIACNLFYPVKEQDSSGQVQCAGGTFNDGTIGWLHGPVVDCKNSDGNGVRRSQLEQIRVVDWVTFGGVLIRREVIDACGSFDDRYEWAYVMDVDYSFEARLRGFLLYQVPVSLCHEESRSTRPILDADPNARARVESNFQAFYNKWRPFASMLTSAAIVLDSQSKSQRV